MYYLRDICCVCFGNTNLEPLSKKDDAHMSYYYKLILSVPQMQSQYLNAQSFMCLKCCQAIDIVYEFRAKCLTNKSIFESYISQLNSEEQARGKISVSLVDIKHDKNEEIVQNEETENRINIKEEIFESPDLLNNNNTLLENEFGCNKINDSFYAGNIDNYIVKNTNCDIKKENVEFSDEFSYRKESNTYVGDEYSNEDIVNSLPNNNAKQEEIRDNFDIKIKSEFEPIENIVEEPFNIKQEPNTDYDESNEDISELPVFDNYIITEEIDVKTEFNDDSYQEYDPILSDQENSTNITETTDVSIQRIQYECYDCGRKYSKKCHLSRHIKKIHLGLKTHEHKDEYYKYKCKLCDKKFFEKNAYKIHVFSHTKKSPFVCEVCGKTFASKYCLKTHSFTHGGRQFPCSLCDKKFYYEKNVKMHMRLHTGEKLYECHFCDKKFIKSSYLDSHVQTHTGIKPHECPVCQRKFSRKEHVKGHMAAIHLSGKPEKIFREKKHQCDICKKKYSSSNYLRLHLEKKRCKIKSDT